MMAAEATTDVADDAKSTVRTLVAPRLQSLRSRLDGDPGNGVLALELARALNAAHEWDEACDRARAAVERLGAPDTVVHGALCYELLYATARKDVRGLTRLMREAQAACKRRPEAAWAHRNMALIYYYTEADARCRAAVARALELDPADVGAHEVRALLSQDDEQTAPLPPSVQAAIDAAPGHARLRKLMGDGCFEAGDSEGARRHYVRALHDEPLLVDAWRALGELCLRHDGDYESAMRCFHHALAINPRLWDIAFTLTDHYVEEKRYDLAKAEVLKVLLLDPDAAIKAEVENHLGYMDYIQGNYEDAVKRYRRAITLDPEFDSPWHNLGLVHVHEKDYDSAIECFKKAIALNADRSWSYTQLGLAYFEKKAYKKAGQLFRQALAKNPEEYGAYLGLAELCRREKDYDEQLACCMRALEVEPNDGNVRNYLGIAYECTKRHDEAVRQYQEALRLDPHNRWAANNLGYLYEKLYASTKSKAYRDKAIAAWRVRLLICRDTATSTAGARRHILKLGVPEATYERWLRDGRLDMELEKVV